MAEVNGMRIAVLKRTATAKVTGIVRGFQHQSEFTIPTQVEENGMTFRVTEIDDAAFRKCSALTSITIPEGIVRIGKLAFAECSSLTSITIPKTVTQIESGRVDIGEYVYRGHLFTNCPCLTSIVVEEGNPKYKSIQNGNGIIDKTTNTLIAGDQTTSIPKDVINIGEYAFACCDALTSITIPNSVTSIGDYAFSGCKALTSVTIPISVTSIGNWAFYYCKALTSVTIPNSVTSIGNSAFYDCHALTSITIPNSVTSIGDDAFGNCDKLTSVTIGNSANNIIGASLGASQSLTSINVDVNNPNYCSIDGVLFDKNQTTLIRYPRGKQGAYIIPNSVTSIGKDAFYYCHALTSVTIPDSVTSIGDNAFYDCDALTSITIPNSVTSIGNSAFYDCDALTSITIPNSVTSIGNSAFYDCNKLTSVTIGNSANNIIGACLGASPSLTSINVDVNNPNYCSIDGVLFDKNQTTLIRYPRGKQGAYIIPNSVTSIGNSAFYECRALASITIPNSVTSIGSSAFSWCTSLTSITIPNSVMTIGERSFYDCKSLTSVTIPNSVTSIGYCAFHAFWSSNANITSVTIENEEGKVAIGKEAFPGKAKITYVGKPKEQPAKPAEKEISQAKPEAPKATTPTNPGLVIDLEKLMAAALVDGVVTDKERAILIKKVKEAGGDVDEFEMLLDARIYEAQQKQAQQQPAQPQAQAPAQPAQKAEQPTITAAESAASNPAPEPEKTQQGRDAWQDNKWLPIVDQIINSLDFVKNGQYTANYGAKGRIGFADSNGKARNFTMFFPKNKELAIGFWWVPQNQEYEAWFAEVNLPCKFLQNTGGQYWYDISISSEALLSDAQLTLIDKMIHISLENFNSK